jgi:hypothetical protein
MKRIRAVMVLAAAIGALALTGCSADPDVSGLESDLAQVQGVNGSMAYATHSGAPWNTQIVVLLFVDDPSPDAVVATAQAAAPVLADDSASSGREVSLYFINGDRADYSGRSAAFSDAIPVTSDIAESLGVSQPASESLRLTPRDVRRLAEASSGS